jgi:hypothetical protein
MRTWILNTPFSPVGGTGLLGYYYFDQHLDMSIASISQVKIPGTGPGHHFWNPPHILPCVEVIKSPYTAILF